MTHFKVTLSVLVNFSKNCKYFNRKIYIKSNLSFSNSDPISGSWIPAFPILEFGSVRPSMDPYCKDLTSPFENLDQIGGPWIPESLCKIRTKSAVRGFLQSPFKIWTDSAIRGSLHPFLKFGPI